MPDTELDEELVDGLKAARKKPRNFAIIALGASVEKILVSKKPIKDGAVMKAKKECGGNKVYRGVVQGAGGGEMVFQVTAEPALQLPKLKKFLIDKSGLQLKPRFEVLAAVPEIDDDEADEAEAAETPPAAEEAAQQPPAAPPAPPGPEAAAFSKRVQALKSDLQKVAAGSTSVSAQVQAGSATMAGLARNGDIAQASKVLDELEPLVRRGLEELAAKASAEGDPAAQFKARLADLVPRIKAVAGTPAGEQAKLKASEAAVFVRKQDFAQARDLLDQAEQLLEDAAPTKTVDTDAGPAFTARQARLEPDLLAAQKADVEKAPKLGAVWAYALGKAESGDFANANKALDGLEKAIQDILTAAGGRRQEEQQESETAPRQETDINAIWNDALDSVHGGLNKLGTVLRQSKDPELDRIADLGLGAFSKNLQVGIRVALMNYMQAAPQDRPALGKKVGKLAGDFRDFLSSDERIDLIDENPFGIDVGVRARLGAALDQIEKAVAQAA